MATTKIWRVKHSNTPEGEEQLYWGKNGWVPAGNALIYRHDPPFVEGGEPDLLVEIKPVSKQQQVEALSYWFVKKNGWRPSEAAMQLGSYSTKKLRRMYQDLIITGKFKQNGPPTAV